MLMLAVAAMGFSFIPHAAPSEFWPEPRDRETLPAWMVPKGTEEISEPIAFKASDWPEWPRKPFPAGKVFMASNPPPVPATSIVMEYLSPEYFGEMLSAQWRKLERGVRIALWLLSRSNN